MRWFELLHCDIKILPNNIRPMRYLKLNIMLYDIKCQQCYGKCDTNELYFRVLQMSGIVRSILTYGDLIRENYGSPNAAGLIYNGSVASVHLFIIVFAIGFCVVPAPFMTKLVDRKFGSTFTKLILLVFMFIGMVVMCCFFKFRHRLLKLRHRPLGSRKKLTLTGIIVFYVFGSVLDIFHLTKNICCKFVYEMCGGHVLVRLVVGITFHVTRIIYFGTETILCLAFSRARFRDTVSTWYGLMLLQAINITNWLQIVMQESTPLHEYVQPYKATYFNECVASLNRNFTPEDLECLNKNTSLHILINDRISPILFPFPYEFSILVGECIFAWLRNCNSSTIEAIDEEEKDHPHQDYQDQHHQDHQDQLHQDHQDPHQDQIQQNSDVEVPVGNTSYGNLSMDESTSLLTSTNRSYQTMRHSLFLLIGVLLNIVFVLMSFFPYLLPNQKAVDFQQTRKYFTSFYCATIILLLFVGYCCLSPKFQQIKTNGKFKNVDYSLLISSVGPYIYGIIWVMIISIEIRDYSGKSAVDELFLVTFSTLSVLIQIPFTYQAERISIPKEVYVDSAEGRSLKLKLLILKVTILHLAISNGTWWILETFAAPQADLLTPDKAAYMKEGVWMMLHNFVQPLVVFFRFKSCIVLTCAYLRLLEPTKPPRNSGTRDTYDVHIDSINHIHILHLNIVMMSN